MTVSEIKATIYKLKIELEHLDNLILLADNKEDLFDLMMEREAYYNELEWLEDDLQVAEGLI